VEEVLTVAAGAFMEVVAVSMAVGEVVSMAVGEVVSMAVGEVVSVVAVEAVSTAVAACGAALPGDFAQKTVAFVAGHRQNATG